MDDTKESCLNNLVEIRKKVRKELDENILLELEIRLEEILTSYFG